MPLREGCLEVLIWLGFIAMILSLLALDLGVFHRRPHTPSTAEALAWSGFWIALALAFTGAVYFLYENNWIGAGLAFPEDVSGAEAGLAYLTGYLLEKSLSLDNIFVIALIFSYFGIPLDYQHRLLFWGILGALVMRGAMIAAGAGLIEHVSWITYVFGGLLLFTAARMLVMRHDNLEPDRNPVIRAARRLYPVTDGLRGPRFLVQENGARHVTPLFLVLLMVESTDLLFAVDSIPAVFAVTADPFLVYTSNVFAILGLRTLYFAVAPLLSRFRFLRSSLVFVLAFVAVKMLLTHHAPIPVGISLAMILGILSVGILASVAFQEVDTAALRSPVEEHVESMDRTTTVVAARVVVLVLGGTALVLGTAWLVLPGPRVLTIAAGLALLGTQGLWAWRLLRSMLSGTRTPAERRNAERG